MPTLSLAIPAPPSRPTTPGGLKLQIPLGGGKPAAMGAPDDSPQESYYGQLPPVHDDRRTVMPVTMIHSSSKDTFAELKDVIQSIAAVSLEEKPKPKDGTDSDDAKLIGSIGSREYNDNVLEELTRLGEGAGGAVHKVKDKRTGEILACKTIPTRTTPARQVLRELQFLSSSVHDNIITFYGAYMSPSTSEVKVVTEVCDGQSLEAVGKRVIELNAASSEKVLGKLAEGVRAPIDLEVVHALTSIRTTRRFCKASPICMGGRLSTATSSPPTCCSPGKAWSSCAISASQGRSWAPSRKRSPARSTTWLYAIHTAAQTSANSSCQPERILGQPYTIRSDVWSTGLTLLELAQKRFPYPHNLGPIDLIQRIVNDAVSATCYLCLSET